MFTLILLEDLVDPTKGFTRNGSEAIIEARVHIGRAELTKAMELDFFSPSNVSDIILIVEGKKLHVSRQILANQSSFFDTLFYGQFKESKYSEIELKDVKLEEFIKLLRLAYGSDDKFIGLDLDALLPVIDRFDMKDDCVRKLKRSYKIDKLMREYPTLPDDLKNELVQKKKKLEDREANDPEYQRSRATKRRLEEVMGYPMMDSDD
ncbi:hypothetical protein PFISCL1PPCAC_21052, partial [Pristionchus fissidentatus]